VKKSNKFVYGTETIREEIHNIFQILSSGRNAILAKHSSCWCREIQSENGDICVVELPSGNQDEKQQTSFDDFYETLRNSKEILFR